MLAQDSPYVVVRRGEETWIDREDLGPVCPVRLSPRPDWYDRKTSTGKPMTRIGSLQGTYLGVYPAKTCEYWLHSPRTSAASARWA